MSASPRQSGKTDVPPSSSDTATPSTKSAGVSWSQRMRDAGFYPVRRDFNRFMYGDWVKLEEVGPVDVGPLPPEVPRHGSSCLCGPCTVAGQVYADYLKARRLHDEGF